VAAKSWRSRWWIQSYRDLPVLINQWGNVVRWEMRTRLFLRTTEFLWQEGHTAHATSEEGQEETMRMLDVYADFAVSDAAIPVIRGQKSEKEKFAGALATYTIEAMMGDCRSLQGATSHNLGQNFAKAFDIQYLDRNNELQHCWTTSWGLSTRMVGAIIMTHGDDKGLVLPPRLAPIQVVIIPIYRDDEQKSQVLPVVEEVRRDLEKVGIRSKVDDREGHTPGWKFNDWEMRGVPLRIEIGPKDVLNEQVMMVRRDLPGKAGKAAVSLNAASERAQQFLQTIQSDLYQKALDFREAHTHHPTDYPSFQQAVESGFAIALWCGDGECEAQIQEDTRARISCIPLDQEPFTGQCIRCGKAASERAIFARAY
jgi:prolyl-tRNA synthetase